MNLQDREKLYVEHMKSVLDQWMSDVHRLEREERACTKRTLERSHIDHLFSIGRDKLKEFYGVDDIAVEKKKEKKSKKCKTQKELDSIRIEALFLPVLMLTHLIDEKIGSVGKLSRLSQEELMILFLEDDISIALIIDALDEFGAPHNFIKTY